MDLSNCITSKDTFSSNEHRMEELKTNNPTMWCTCQASHTSCALTPTHVGPARDYITSDAPINPRKSPFELPYLFLYSFNIYIYTHLCLVHWADHCYVLSLSLSRSLKLSLCVCHVMEIPWLYGHCLASMVITWLWVLFV